MGTPAVLIARIDRERLSRNKHYALYEDPAFRRVHRIHHYFLRLLDQLERYPDRRVSLRLDASSRDTVVLRIESSALKFVWTVFLSREELTILKQLGGHREIELFPET